MWLYFLFSYFFNFVNNRCDSISYSKTLPSTSIVICFYNEHFETLLRTLHTIVRNTPAHLLHEIILVDDFSDIGMITKIECYVESVFWHVCEYNLTFHFLSFAESLHDLVRKYLSTSAELKSVVHFHKTKRREGLIRARIFGANLASGEVSVYLQVHLFSLEYIISIIYFSLFNILIVCIKLESSETNKY